MLPTSKKNNSLEKSNESKCNESKKSNKSKKSKKNSWTEYVVIGKYLQSNGVITLLYRKTGNLKRFYLKKGDGINNSFEKIFVKKSDNRILK